VHQLTGEQLTEVCVRFAVFMGWITGPGSAGWVREVHRQYGPEGFHKLMTAARQSAVDMTAGEGITTNLEALKRLEARDAG